MTFESRQRLARNAVLVLGLLLIGGAVTSYEDAAYRLLIVPATLAAITFILSWKYDDSRTHKGR